MFDIGFLELLIIGVVALIVLTLVSFGAVAVAQSLFPHWAHPHG